MHSEAISYKPQCGEVGICPQLTITLVGLFPTEHTSFFLETLPYRGFSPVRLQGWPIRRRLPSEAPNCRAQSGLHPSFALLAFKPVCPRCRAIVRLSITIGATMVALPQGASLRSGLCCPVHLRSIDPIRRR